ncbi:uncharacterized protein ACRADG_005201 isoform 1-T2 [Cochliomyia hominivorax]
MADVPKIIDLPSVVEPHLKGGKLITFSSRYLTKAGDNYGSVMLAIMANIQKPSGEIEELPLVAKLPPLTNDLFWQMFQPERTCVTENAVYKYLSPAIRSLQLEASIGENELFEGFPEYYGSRISLNPNTQKVDRDAVLVQENLQTSGYRAGNRHKAFDLKHTKLIIREMAKYHALPIALRIKKPEEFNKNIRPYFRRFNMNTGMSTEVKAQMEAELYQEVANATNNNDNCVERVKEMMKEYDTFVAQPDKEDDLFTSIVHCDMWINNLMIQYDENSEPNKVKFVDFQIAQYENCVHDIIFFLFSSVEISVLEYHFDEILQLYYQTFIECLKSVNISTIQYSFVGFMKEIHNCAPVEICHALFMTKIILADNSTMPDNYKDINMDVLSRNVGKKNITEKTADIIRIAQKYKFFYKD